MSSNMGIAASGADHLPMSIAARFEAECCSRQDAEGADDANHVQWSMSHLWEDLSEKAKDAELMRALSAGDNEAMVVLFARYHKLVRSIALRIIHDRSEAEEVVQNVFIDLFRAADRFDISKGSIKSWVLQYAYHRALHRKRHLVANRFYEWEELDSVPQSVVRTYCVPPELAIFVNQLVGSLDGGQQDVIKLAYFEGFTAEEISFRLSKSVHVVRHDLRRAIAAMRARARSRWSFGLRTSNCACEGIS